MPKPNTKGISVHVDAGLHAEIRAYLEAQEMTMGEFIARAAQDELHPRSSELDPELQAEVMAHLEDSDITVDEFIALAVQNELHPQIPGIDDALKAEIQAYLEENEMDIGDFIANAAQNELHPKTHEPEVNSMEKEPTRTLAFQVPESLFERVKQYLERNNMTQKAFVIGLIEDELDRDEDLVRKQQENARAAEEEEPDEGLSEGGETPVSENGPEVEQGDKPEETAAVGDFEGGSDEQDKGELEQELSEDEPDEMPDYEDEPSEEDFSEIEDGSFPGEQDEGISGSGEAPVSENSPEVEQGDGQEETAAVNPDDFSAIMNYANHQMVEIAKSQLGNVGGEPYWSWYGFGGRVEWCACFVSWCADQCGYIDRGIIPKFAGCGNGVDWFKDKNQWLDGSATPESGNIIFFDWVDEYGIQDGNSDHVGIVEKVEGGRVYTIEGNSGDACQQNSYPVGYFEILGYGTPSLF